MAKKYLDYNGLQYFWQKIKSIIPNFTSDLTNDSGFVTTDDNIEWVDVDVLNGGGGGGATVNTYVLTEPVASIEFDLNGAEEASIALEVPNTQGNLTYGFLIVNGNQSGFFTFNPGSTNGKRYSFLSIKRISSGRWLLTGKKGNGGTYEDININSSATVPIVGGVIELEITSFGYKCYGSDELPEGTVITEIIGGRL